MTARALPLAPIAPTVRVECAPLRATISARQCLAVQRRTERRPIGCAACPIGDAVRAGAGDTGPAPVARIVVATELAPAPPPAPLSRRRVRARAATAALATLVARHGSHTAACRVAGVSPATGYAMLERGHAREDISARFIAAAAVPADYVPATCCRPGCDALASTHPTKFEGVEGLCSLHRIDARNALRFDRTSDIRLCTGCYGHRAVRGSSPPRCRGCCPVPTDPESIAAWSARRAVK